MNNLLILKCDEENILHKLAARICNIKKFIEMSADGTDFTGTCVENETEGLISQLHTAEKLKY